MQRRLKIRHTETVDCPVVAIAGPPDRPIRLMVRLPDSTETETAQLSSAQRPVVGQALMGILGEALPEGWRQVTALVVAEVEVGTTRHRTVRFVRLRQDLL